MFFTREVILKCFYGDGCSRIDIFTRKSNSSGETFLGELYSPASVIDGSGRKLTIHGDGRIRKHRTWRKIEEIMKLVEEDHGEHGMR
jgi:hypothetical protein